MRAFLFNVVKKLPAV